MRGIVVIWAVCQTGCIAAGTASSAGRTQVSPVEAGKAQSAVNEGQTGRPAATTQSETAGSASVGAKNNSRECPLPEKARLSIKGGVLVADNGWSYRIDEAANGKWELAKTLAWCFASTGQEYILELPDDTAGSHAAIVLGVLPVSVQQKAVLVVDGSEVPFRRTMDEVAVGQWVRVTFTGEKIEAIKVARDHRNEKQARVVARRNLRSPEDIAPWIESTCSAKPGCLGVVVDAPVKSSAGYLKPLLVAASKAGHGKPPVFVVRTPEMTEPDINLDPDDLPIELGRLAPEVIQSIVRENFGAFRKCYENGLARNPNLTGRVSVRFVIAHDGRVIKSEDGGSDLPDKQVIACLVDGFNGLHFPQPEGGIVTVVYPIMLEPG